MFYSIECDRKRPHPGPYDPNDPVDPWQPGLWEQTLDEGAKRSAIGCAWSSETQLPLYGDRECSKSPDLAPECCAYHDTDYAVGGTEQDRLVADLELAWCFSLYGIDERVVWVYYRSVRKFGASSFNLQEHRTRGPPEKPGGWRRPERSE